VSREQQERAKWALPFVKAIAEGKTVQYKDFAGEWRDHEGDVMPRFGLAQDRYRIKPDPPVERWARVYSDGSTSCMFTSKEALDSFFRGSGFPGRVICLREVRE